jgi:DNA modification methylase
MKQGKPYYRGMVDNSSNRTCPTKTGKLIEGKNDSGLRYPKTIIEFDNNDRTDTIHPTQKPVALMQYLIRTYTNPGDTVLDFTCGSGTTLLAAKLEGRKCIGIERDTGKDGECLGYCKYAVDRLAQSCMVFA